jgi:hypothetical protein
MEILVLHPVRLKAQAHKFSVGLRIQEMYDFQLTTWSYVSMARHFLLLVLIEYIVTQRHGQ